MIEIIVTPLGRGKFEAQLGDRVIVRSTSEPLLAASRALIAEGVAPGTCIAMRHERSPHVALSSTVGKAAKLTVKDDARGVPRLRPWMPPPGVTPRSPMRLGEEETPDIAPELEALTDEVAP